MFWKDGTITTDFIGYIFNKPSLFKEKNLINVKTIGVASVGKYWEKLEQTIKCKLIRRLQIFYFIENHTVRIIPIISHLFLFII